jgi:DNA-3-methyladenine glycosylase I
MKKTRCEWAESHELMIPYHDQEWGVPVHDDGLLFEMLNLEGAQAGLSWLTILKKRENYRKAFDRFNAKKIIKYDAAKKKVLLSNEGIVRNKLKVNAVIENAKAFLEIQREFGSFDQYIWQFAEGNPVEASALMSKALKKRGFKFVGATICYAFMQAVGIVNDHTTTCFRYRQVPKSKR